MCTMSPESTQKGHQSSFCVRKKTSFDISELIKNSENERYPQENSAVAEDRDEAMNLSAHEQIKKEYCSNSDIGRELPGRTPYQFPVEYLRKSAKNSVSDNTPQASLGINSPSDSGYGSESPSPQQPSGQASAFPMFKCGVPRYLDAETDEMRQQNYPNLVNPLKNRLSPMHANLPLLYQQLLYSMNSHFLARSQQLALNNLSANRKQEEKDSEDISFQSKRRNLSGEKIPEKMETNSQKTNNNSQDEALNLTMSNKDEAKANKMLGRQSEYLREPQEMNKSKRRSNSDSERQPSLPISPPFSYHNPYPNVGVPPYLPPAHPFSLEPYLRAIYGEKWRLFLTSPSGMMHRSGEKSKNLFRSHDLCEENPKPSKSLKEFELESPSFHHSASLYPHFMGSHSPHTTESGSLISPTSSCSSDKSEFQSSSFVRRFEDNPKR